MMGEYTGDMMAIDSAVLDQAQDPEADSMHTVVSGIDGDGETWNEEAEVFSYTASGLGFYMNRECAVGNLISLMLQLPSHLRCYDFDEEFYNVWAVVQNCNFSRIGGSQAYQLGVAFIGSEPPASYDADPSQNYRICGMNNDGLWKVTEADSRFVQRKELRHWRKIKLYLAMIDARRESIGGERCSTENVSRHGAALITNLELHIGDRVKIISEAHDFSSLAVVCNVRACEDGKSRVNLEFIGHTFPVERLKTSKR